MNKILGVALLCIGLWLCGAANAAPRHGVTAAVTPQGQTILNVGNYTSDGGEYPFINMVKGGIGWPSASPTLAYPAILNANNYPVTGSLASQIGFSIPVPDFYCDPATVWVFEWTGTQGNVTTPGLQLSVTGGVTVTTGSGFVKGATTSGINMYGTDGYIEFTFSTQHASGILPLNFMAGANFPGTLGNVAMYRKSQQTAYRAGLVFNPDYVAVVQALRPRAVRMLNWNLANGSSNIANSAQMTPVTALTYGFYWDPTIWAVASGTNTYTATVASVSSIVDGTTVQLLMTNANTAASTLNINGLGAISIGDMNGSAISTASTIAANGLWTFIYDIGLNLWLGQSGGLHTGVPVSLLPVFANQVGADLWVNYPPHATNAFADFITTTVRDGLNNTGWFEYANEVWNFGAGFQQTPWAIVRGDALGWSTSSGADYHSWYGFRARQTLGNVATIYGGNPKFKRVLAFQAFGDPVATEKYRMKGFNLNGTNFPLYAAAGYPNYDTAPNRPLDVADIFSYATYYSGGQIKNSSGAYANSMTADGPPGYTVGLLGAADDYATGIPVNMANALSFVDWDFRQGTRNGTMSTQVLLSLASVANIGIGALGIYPSWNTYAVTYSKSVANYEGAMEATYPIASRCTALSISTSYCDIGGKINLLLLAYKNSTLFQTLVGDQFSQFMASSKSLYPSWYEIAVCDQWAIYCANIYSTPYKSQAGIAGFHFP